MGHKKSLLSIQILSLALGTLGYRESIYITHTIGGTGWNRMKERMFFVFSGCEAQLSSYQDKKSELLKSQGIKH